MTIFWITTALLMALALALVLPVLIKRAPTAAARAPRGARGSSCG